ncbi:MAG TPA: nucleotidyltransferase domain-containing protein [Chthonomonadales bacterium]|nr:nucleotidyltransferase domain-containing protein [Chthonomonadales bacterium]
MTWMAAPQQEVAAFRERRGVERMALFGPVPRDALGPESDVDVLVRSAPGARRSWFDVASGRQEPIALSGREVHPLSWRAIETGRNPYRSAAILSTAQVI